MVRYKTKEDASAANEALIRAVFDELREQAPSGFRYESYRLADGVSFVHLASTEGSRENPLASLPAFKAFRSGISDRCSEEPVVTELDRVDSYASEARG